jgi:DDE domain
MYRIRLTPDEEPALEQTFKGIVNLLARIQCVKVAAWTHRPPPPNISITGSLSKLSAMRCGYFRFCLSFRDVEEILLERGVVVTYEAIRQWCRKFGQGYANHLRRRRPRPGDKWHLDEVFLTIKGERQYLWRTVDQDGSVSSRASWLYWQWKIGFGLEEERDDGVPALLVIRDDTTPRRDRPGLPPLSLSELWTRV